jgi:hypothetical protein
MTTLIMGGCISKKDKYCKPDNEKEYIGEIVKTYKMQSKYVIIEPSENYSNDFLIIDEFYSPCFRINAM